MIAQHAGLSYVGQPPLKLPASSGSGNLFQRQMWRAPRLQGEGSLED